MGDDGSSGSDGKVERVIDEYDLDGLGAELEARWLGEGDDRWSLRDLADWFNRQLLTAALERAGSMPLDGEVANVYRILRDDDASTGMVTSVRRRLEREGIDVEALQRDFVSHQTIHTYLRDHRDVARPDEQIRVADEKRTIGKLEGRTAAVTENSLDRLRDAGEIDLGEFEVFTRVEVLCVDCGAQYEAGRLLDRGGCDCPDT
jgi:hypothetical protein